MVPMKVFLNILDRKKKHTKLPRMQKKISARIWFECGLELAL